MPVPSPLGTRSPLALTLAFILLPWPCAPAAPAGVFVRGDANQDARVDLTDAVATLESLFLRPTRTLCLDAADSDDNGLVQISDPIHTLNFLFLGHGSPADPFPDAGTDQTADTLDCSGSGPGEEEGDGLAPPRPLAAADLEAEWAEEAITGLAGFDGAILVSREVFDLLQTLGEGDTLLDHLDVPGAPELLVGLDYLLPEPASPLAVPAELLGPADADGCYVIRAADLRGNSIDTGPDPTPVEALRFLVEPERVCGLGPHLVRFTVVDADGKESSAMTAVTVCAPEDGHCGGRTVVVPPPPPESQAPPVAALCFWVVVPQAVPAEPVEAVDARYYNPEGELMRRRDERPILFSPDPMRVTLRSIGAGPRHLLVAGRYIPNCQTPASDAHLFGLGYYTIDINLVCIDTAKNLVPRPQNCTAFVSFGAYYHGKVAAASDAGERCDGLTNRIEAAAQGETRFQVDETAVFNKAISVQNGNNIRSAVSFELNTNLGARGDGLAADVGLRFGHTQSVWDRTGRREDFVFAHGTYQKEIPRYGGGVQAALEAAGRVSLTAENSASGMASAVTQVAAIYALAVSNCPGASSPTCDAYMVGISRFMGDLIARIVNFFLARTGDPELARRVGERLSAQLQ